MWSDRLKTVAWIELTSPWEENMTKWHFDKHEKYGKLAHQLRAKGWKAIPICVEVGARGHTNHKWHHFAKAVGFSKAESRLLKARVARVAQRCSYYLYLNRKNKEWVRPPLIESHSD